MKNHLLAYTILALSLISSCGTELDKKKNELSRLQTELDELKNKIEEKKEEILLLDSTYGSTKAQKLLVTALDIKPTSFEHKIEVRGSISSRTNVNVGSEVAGKILKIRAKEGKRVMKGDVVLTLDDEILSNNIAELETSLELAVILADKQAKLWKQNIGTEIQYLQSQNNRKTLERKLTTAKSQLRLYQVKAPFSGTIDEVVAKVGEMAQPGMPLIRMINLKDMHLNAEVSERFIGKFSQGDAVSVYFPSQDKKLVTTITSIGNVINNQNRTFSLEIKLPNTGFTTKPNQVVLIKLVDYKNDSALVVPSKLIQKDNRGSFVFGLKTIKNDTKAEKIYVKAGKSYNNQTEVLEGLKLGDVIAFKGYRELSQGTLVTIQHDEKSQSTMNN